MEERTSEQVTEERKSEQVIEERTSEQVTEERKSEQVTKERTSGQVMSGQVMDVCTVNDVTIDSTRLMRCSLGVAHTNY